MSTGTTSKNARGERILVVDDEPALRELVKRRLEAAGFNTLQAEDGWTALTLIKTERPDLVVLDMLMPGMDGLRVIRKVREDPEIASIPILVLSAKNRPVDTSAGLDIGADDYLGKPFEFPELLARVNALLRRAEGKWASQEQAQIRGSVVAFLGSKGGVGASTVAANVAYGMAAAGTSTILADLTAFHGAAAALVGLRARRRVDRLPLDRLDLLTAGMVEGTLLTHQSGLRVLAGSASTGGEPGEESITSLIELTRGLAQMVVLDLEGVPGGRTRAAALAANQVWVVTTAETLAVDRAGELVQAIESWGVEPQRIGLLLNQAGTSAPNLTGEIAERTGSEVLFSIPAAPQAWHESLARGAPLAELARGTRVADALLEIAAAIVATPSGFPKAVRARAAAIPT